MDQDFTQPSIQDLIEDVSALVAEPFLPDSLNPDLDIRTLETTEQKVVRLLEIARDPAQRLEAYQQDEIHLLSEMVASRAWGWKSAARSLHERSQAMEQESKRIQELADTLAHVANLFAAR